LLAIDEGFPGGVLREPRGAVKPPLPGGADAVGRVLFTDYLFPFEVTSVLLLAAIVGVMALTKRRA
jgi:NADH-quinone oxidoreductase subunit J